MYAWIPRHRVCYCYWLLTTSWSDYRVKAPKTYQSLLGWFSCLLASTAFSLSANLPSSLIPDSGINLCTSTASGTTETAVVIKKPVGKWDRFAYQAYLSLTITRGTNTRFTHTRWYNNNSNSFTHTGVSIDPVV